MKEAQKVDALARGHPGVDACAPGSGVMGTCVRVPSYCSQKGAGPGKVQKSGERGLCPRTKLCPELRTQHLPTTV